MTGYRFFKRLTLFAAAAALALPVARADQLSSSGQLLDRIVAVVNEGILLQSELDTQTGLIVRQLRDQNTQLPAPEVIKGQVLEQLILKELQLQRARRLGIQVPDAMLNATLSQVASRNGLTLTQLPQAMAADGIDYASFREDMRSDMVIEALHQRAVVARIQVSEREIERYLERQESSANEQVDYDLSHILIAIPASSRPEEVADAERRVGEVHNRLVQGEDFAELAITYSDGQNALDGGQLGWRKGGQLPGNFEQIVSELSPGQFSAPVRSQSGYHILKVNDVRGTEKFIVLQTHTRHVLVQPDEILDDNAIRAKMQRIRQRIVEDGEDFGDVARLESADPGSAPKGGDLGWTSPGSFIPAYEAEVAKLSPGEISQPFRTDYGWHIVQLLDRKERDTTDEVKRDRAIQAIRSGKQEQETDIWLRQLRDEAYVEIRG
jgi:peptidyl-prolyl cis-trans isomerase SurA